MRKRAMTDIMVYNYLSRPRQTCCHKTENVYGIYMQTYRLLSLFLFY